MRWQYCKKTSSEASRLDNFYFGTSQESWVDLVIPAASLLVSVVAVSISFWIASRQRELQERQLRKDLFDRRFDVYTKVREFMTYVLRNDGKISLTADEYRDFQGTMEKAEMLCEKVHPYLVELDKTVRGLYVYKQEENRAVETGDVKRIEDGANLMKRCIELLRCRNEVFRSYLSLEHQVR